MKWETKSGLQQQLGVELPIPGILGGKDSVVDTGAARGVFEAIQAPAKKIKEWPNAHHELLNDLDKEEVKQEILKTDLTILYRQKIVPLLHAFSD